MASKNKESAKAKKTSEPVEEIVAVAKGKAPKAAELKKAPAKASANKAGENVEVKEDGESNANSLLDLSADAVKKMIKAAKKRGYVTMDELNNVLPSDEVTSEQIEDTMSMLSDMGINVVEEEEVGRRS